MEELAIRGGKPVREKPLPYGRQSISSDDVRAVSEALVSDYLTTGPKVGELEVAFARATGAAQAVVVSNGTAALHAAMHALGIGPGDEVVVPPLTFAASASCVLYQGGTPVFADVDADTLLLDPAAVAGALTDRTRAIVAVDFAGQPCDYAALGELARARGIAIVADACHALGAAQGDRPVGSLADLTAFSLHPVKHVTSGEGGVITTNSAPMAESMRRFRHHGMLRNERHPWIYELHDLGYNYRLTDFQCALALSQLGQLDGWVDRRRAIAVRYDRELPALPAVKPLGIRPGVRHSYHLYVVRLELDRLTVDRDQFLEALRAEGILAVVHYPCVHLQPYYRRRFGFASGLFPRAEQAASSILSLPVFPRMSDQDQSDVLAAVNKVASAFSR